MTCSNIDLEQLSYDQLASEYKNSTNLIGHMNIQVKQQQELLDVFCSISEMLDVETAIGDQLDIIGRIVGIDILLVNAKEFEFFGFTGGLTNNLGFGDLFDNTVGGPFISFGQGTGSNIILNDEQYRILIKAKIITNNGYRSTPEELIELLKFTFNIENFTVTESTMAVFVMIGDPISSFERNLINLIIEDPLGGDPGYLIPQTLSVRYHYGQYDPENVFSFSPTSVSEFDNDFGFGDFNDPNIGGKFAGFF